MSRHRHLARNSPCRRRRRRRRSLRRRRPSAAGKPPAPRGDRGHPSPRRGSRQRAHPPRGGVASRPALRSAGERALRARARRLARRGLLVRLGRFVAATRASATRASSAAAAARTSMSRALLSYSHSPSLPSLGSRSSPLARRQSDHPPRPLLPEPLARPRRQSANPPWQAAP